MRVVSILLPAFALALIMAQESSARDIAGPIFGINSKLYHPMKRRMRPIPHACHQAMFHRVDMDVVDVALEITFIANCVFPIAALPDPAFTLGSAAS